LIRLSPRTYFGSGEKAIDDLSPPGARHRASGSPGLVSPRLVLGSRLVMEHAVRKAAAVWLISLTLLLAYEGYAVLNSTPGDTLSEAVWKYGQHPMVALAVGICLGHFFWQRRCK
jgi:hypothetical protein